MFVPPRQAVVENWFRILAPIGGDNMYVTHTTKFLFFQKTNLFARE